MCPVLVYIRKFEWAVDSVPLSSLCPQEKKCCRAVIFIMCIVVIVGAHESLSNIIRDFGEVVSSFVIFSACGVITLTGIINYCVFTVQLFKTC